MDSNDAVTGDELTRALDVHSLRILVAIHREGSISAAARALGFTQPTITQHVQRFETRLGTPLVARTARSARLTPAGALLAQHAPRIDASLTAAATELARLLGREAGAVRIAAHPDLMTNVVAPTLGRLIAEMPGLQLTVAEAAADEALDMVRDGRTDIALITTFADHADPATRRTMHGLRSTFLFGEEILAITTSQVDTTNGRIDASELASLPWIFGDGTATSIAAERAARSYAAGDLTVSRTDSALALVAQGIGATFIAERALSGVLAPELRVLGLAPSLRRRTMAVTLREAEDIPAVAAAVRLLALHHPSAVDIEATRGSRRRAAGQRARFSHGLNRRQAGLGHLTTSSRHPAVLNVEESSDMPSMKRVAHIGAVAATSAVLLSGCTADAGPSTGGVDSGEAIDNITVALPGSLSNLYVGQESGILNFYIASITQEGLVSVDAQGRIQPGLAESWEHPDDVTYVYQLREDAYFQDGSPVTADDVVFSLQQARDETVSPGIAYILAGVKDVQKTGDREVTITLTAPNAAFAATMSTGGGAFITSKAFWEEHDGRVGTPDSLLLGTGPYQVTKFIPDSSVTFERVDSWWGEEPAVESITVEFVPDESTRLLAAQAGDVDVAFNVPLAQSQQWESLDAMSVDYTNDLSYVGLFFNTSLEPFDDPKVREAFAHAVDRDAVVERLLRGHGEAATTIMTPESLGQVYDADAAREKLTQIPQWEFDLDAAKAALADSSHPDGFETEILTPSTGPQLGTAAQALAENLRELGITLKVREVPIEEWLASLDASSSYGVGLMWYFSTLGDPGEISGYLLGAGNPSAYDNPRILELLSQAGSESDPAARIELLLEVETLQAEDVVNVPLWWGQSATAISKDLGIRDQSSFAFISSWPTQIYRTNQ